MQAAPRATGMSFLVPRCAGWLLMIRGLFYAGSNKVMWVWPTETGSWRHWALFGCLFPWIRELRARLLWSPPGMALPRVRSERGVQAREVQAFPCCGVRVPSPCPPHSPSSQGASPSRVPCAESKQSRGELLTRDLVLLGPWVQRAEQTQSRESFCTSSFRLLFFCGGGSGRSL